MITDIGDITVELGDGIDRVDVRFGTDGFARLQPAPESPYPHVAFFVAYQLAKLPAADAAEVANLLASCSSLPEALDPSRRVECLESKFSFQLAEPPEVHGVWPTSVGVRRGFSAQLRSTRAGAPWDALAVDERQVGFGARRYAARIASSAAVVAAAHRSCVAPLLQVLWAQLAAFERIIESGYPISTNADLDKASESRDRIRTTLDSLSEYLLAGGHGQAAVSVAVEVLAFSARAGLLTQASWRAVAADAFDAGRNSDAPAVAIRRSLKSSGR